MNRELMNFLLNKVVKVDRGGPESRIGKVLNAQTDYFTLLTEEDGVVFYKYQHIKSITHDSKNGMKLNVEVPEDFPFAPFKDFKSLLTELRHKWVKVNRGGPESVEGVLEEVFDDFITIVKNNEVIRVAMYHIRNISYGIKSEKEKKQEE